MKCFTHSEVDSVGQCSHCHRGVCPVCARAVSGATFCPACYEAGLRQEIGRARQRVTGVWLFTGIITGLAVLISISEQAGSSTILIAPITFAASWSLFWGWSPVWNGFRRALGGLGCFFAPWLLVLIVGTILVGISILVGLFTGIQKYQEARQIAANGG